MALSDALDRVPDAPLASNFTARVLQAVERDLAKAERESRSKMPLRRFWMRWVPGGAGLALVLGVGLVSYHQLRESHRIQLVRSVATISEVAALPSAQVLEDFDAIHAMSQRPTPDEELLKLLQ